MLFFFSPFQIGSQNSSLIKSYVFFYYSIGGFFYPYSQLSSLIRWKTGDDFGLTKENRAVVSPTVIYKPGKIPKGNAPELQISWNLLRCLWALLQLDQCIMSWHGPSLCADSSVTLRDNVKFISAVSPSQLVRPLDPHPHTPLAIMRWCLSVHGGHRGNWIHHRFLLQVSDASQRNAWLR